MGLATRDALLYAELAPILRDRRIPTVSLLPGERVPDNVAIVLTSTDEIPRIHHRNVLGVPSDGDRTALWAAVAGALGAQDPSSELIVGIDPGPRPGYAVVAEGQCLAEGNLDAPEGAARLGGQLHRRFPSRSIRFRVGSGDPLRRDRIVNALIDLHRPIEVVDEQHTTPRGARRPRDAAAARAIAAAMGRPARGRTPLTVTPGEVANLQRVTREGSGGRFTLPRADARRVLEGEISLSDAIAEGERRYRSLMPSAGRRATGRSEPS